MDLTRIPQNLPRSISDLGLRSNQIPTVASDIDHDHQYEDIDKQDTLNQTEQGQSKAITKSNTKTTVATVTSVNDQTGQGHTNDLATIVTNDHDHEDMESQHDLSGQCQSQAITEPNTNSTITIIPPGVFSNLANLTKLYLSKNQITSFHSGSFSKNTKAHRVVPHFQPDN
ncbi:uncharacterized protein [Branchiostoma lanceolatum]|uniref:uncharacterized protein n=1 Tax=Branchiostoma lanceolatum TaxID=7740 RepID=UPI003452CCFF